MAVATDPAHKLQLEKQLEAAEAERTQIEQELELLGDQSKPPQETRADASAEGEHTTTDVDVVLKKIKKVDEVTGVETERPPEGSTKIRIEDVKKGKKVTGMTIKKV